jgi:hypothetical protein
MDEPRASSAQRTAADGSCATIESGGLGATVSLRRRRVRLHSRKYQARGRSRAATKGIAGHFIVAVQRGGVGDSSRATLAGRRSWRPRASARFPLAADFSRGAMVRESMACTTIKAEQVRSLWVKPPKELVTLSLHGERRSAYAVR